MRKEKLSAAQKKELIRMYKQAEWTQDSLGAVFRVSPTTVRRVLKEAGVLPKRVKWTQDQERIIALVSKHGLTPETLEKKLTNPFALVPPPGSQPTYPEMVNLLIEKDQKYLANLMYEVFARKLGNALKEEAKEAASA